MSIIGERFGRLLALAPGEPHIQPSGKRYSTVLCLCDCGNRKQVLCQSLRRGATKSCGCLLREAYARASNESAQLRKKHPGEYNSWAQMRSRCNDPGANGYHRYGGRGITVCSRWSSFGSFLEDMGQRPSGHSIDRIDVNGNYEPSNCRWSSSVEQALNTSRTQFITLNGETKPLVVWCDELGLNRSTVRVRLHRGWSIEEALK